MATLSTIASVLSVVGGVVGTGLSIFGAIQQGRAQDAAAQYQANVATVNAGIAEENAQRVQQTAAIEQLQQDNESAALFGAQEAGQSASGLSVKSGSFLATRRSARKLARQDALNIRQQGDVQAYGFRTDKANELASAEFSRAQGKSALASSYLDAASSFVGGATSVLGGASRFSAFGSKAKAASSLSRRDPWRGLRSTT